MFSNACNYGLRAMLYLAAHPPEGFVSIRTVGDALGISVPFLAKIFQQLVQGGLVASYRGPSGGVRLTRAPEAITLRQVIEAVDGPGLFQDCVLGLPGCGHRQPCPFHARWAEERKRLEDLFGSTTLSDASAGVRDQVFRLGLVAADT